MICVCGIRGIFLAILLLMWDLPIRISDISMGIRILGRGFRAAIILRLRIIRFGRLLFIDFAFLLILLLHILVYTTTLIKFISI